MGAYAYEARTIRGELVSGIVSATTMDEAGKRLGDDDLFIVRLGPTKEGARARVARRAAGRRVKRESVIWFNSQLAIMVETGINISEALDCLARQTSDEAFKETLDAVAKNVREGRPLSDSIAVHSRAFPSIMPALIRAGEMSGTMSSILSRLSTYLQTQAAIVKKLRSAMIYPMFMLLMCISVTVFLLTVILPKFAKIFADKGAALPTPTRILMTVSDLAIQFSYLWVGLVIAAAIGGYFWIRTPVGARQLDWLKLNTPVIGSIFRKLYLARTFRTLGTLIHSGVPLTDSLQIAQDISGNAYFCDLWAEVNARVTRGERIAGPLLTSAYVDESIGYMVESGDKSGQLGRVFERLAEFTEQEFDDTVKTAMQFIEPAMILVLGSMIGFIAISLLMPMFSAGNVVAK